LYFLSIQPIKGVIFTKLYKAAPDDTNLLFSPIHSTLDECEVIHQQKPYLELTCGPWISGQTRSVPSLLIKEIQRLVKK